MRVLPCLFLALLLGNSFPVAADVLYSIIDLGTLGGSLTQATGINNAGQVVGYASTSSSSFSHAFLYSNGRMTDLGTLPGYIYSQGKGINNAGQVVGMSGGHAFLYSDGQMRDLNSLIDPALHITLFEADGINDQGQIVASPDAFSVGFHTYLLTPTATAVPESSTLALFSVALLGLGAWVRYHPSVFR